ncbi:50S ribosomal protein L18e [uncultured archaeon]|nr:50S ribosomal protein L18e [uncultured archaeon]
MVRTIRYENPARLDVIQQLKKASKEDSAIWERVAKELSRSRRQRREVNIHKINRFTQDGDIIVVPGKVLGDGDIDHSVIVAAFQFTEGAKIKIESAGGSHKSILDIAKENPSGTNIKIIC